MKYGFELRYVYEGEDRSESLMHYGVVGMKKGVRTKQYVPKGRTPVSMSEDQIKQMQRYQNWQRGVEKQDKKREEEAKKEKQKKAKTTRNKVRDKVKDYVKEALEKEEDKGDNDGNSDDNKNSKDSKSSSNKSSKRSTSRSSYTAKAVKSFPRSGLTASAQQKYADANASYRRLVAIQNSTGSANAARKRGR